MYHCRLLVVDKPCGPDLAWMTALGKVEKDEMISQVDMLCEVLGSLMAVAMVFTEEFSRMLFLLLLTSPLMTWGSELQG